MTSASLFRSFWIGLYLMIDHGIPIIRALTHLHDFLRGQGRFAEAILKMAEKIEAGQSLSEAMDESGYFSIGEVEMVRAGELGGILEQMIGDITESCNGLTKADEYVCVWTVLEVLTKAGTPILKVIDAAKLSCGGRLQASVLTLYDKVKNGGSIAEAMEESGMFTPFEVVIVRVGEETGAIDRSFGQLANLSGCKLQSFC